MNLKRFDVYWVALDPTVGHEIRKQRPGVILSPDDLNEDLATVIIAPLTSVLRDYPFRPQVGVGEKPSQVALDQLRSVDKVRLRDKMGHLTDAEQNRVLELLEDLFD